MAAPNSAFTDIVATTLQGYSGELADNVTNHNALLRQINRKGNKRYATGRTIVQELEYAENQTAMWYSGAEVFDVSPSETFTAAEFNWKQLIGAVVISGLEEIQNSGREAIHNLVKARVRNLERTLTNRLATALYADGTGSASKEIGGLQLLTADVNTNTVGGIPAATYAFWRNYVYDFSTNVVVPSATTIQHAMNTAWIAVIRGADKPDIITADALYWIYYLESLQPNQRFTDDRKAGAGFTNVVFMADTPVVYDDQCPASHMYMLQTDFIFLRPSKKREFTPLADRASVNQDALVMPVAWAGNMTVSNRGQQAVICA
jgi:hypothetical protein